VIPAHGLHPAGCRISDVFPESAGQKDGQRAERPPEEEISVEAAAMAYLMRGIHF
jgi:hypothetical protein